MFSVLFEVNPHQPQWDAYLDAAKTLRPELEQIEGFIDNIRYASLTRPGWILSLSNWRNEKALVRWRTRAHHHDIQAKGRDEILADYHLRVGQVTHDSHLPDGETLSEQRLDETEVGAGTTVTLINGTRPAGWIKESRPDSVAGSFALDVLADGLVGWDVFDAVLAPGEAILLLSWRTDDHAAAFEHSQSFYGGDRVRRVRVVRDYGMYDRRENPQFYPHLPNSVGAE